MSDKEIPICTEEFYGEPTLFRMWAGAIGLAEIYVWGHSFEHGLEALYDYCADEAPGCIVTHERFLELLDEAAQEAGYASWEAASAHEDEECDAVVEVAATDLTCAGGHTSHATLSMYMPCDEWGGREVDPDSDEYREVLARTLAEVLELEVDGIAFELEAVSEWVSSERKYENVAFEETDVRLCVERDGSWEVRSGDVSYDTRHAFVCGTGTVTGDETEAEIQDLVRDLIAQCLDAVY